MTAMLWISQVQWYSIGDALHLVGVGFLFGGIAVGTLVWFVRDGSRGYKEDPKNSLYPPQTPPY